MVRVRIVPTDILDPMFREPPTRVTPAKGKKRLAPGSSTGAKKPVEIETSRPGSKLPEIDAPSRPGKGKKPQG
jgi:hypothetical protein